MHNNIDKFVCSECNGRCVTEQAYIFVFEGSIMEGTRMIDCPKCLGDGEVDWIENIVGKKDDISVVLTTGMEPKFAVSHIRKIKNSHE